METNPQGKPENEADAGADASAESKSQEQTSAPPLTGSMASVDQEQCTWAMACHLASLVGYLQIVPVLGIVGGPLVVWWFSRDGRPFVDQQGKEALNFQITVFIVLAILTVLSVIGLFCVTVPLAVVVSLVAMVFSIIGGIKANQGEEYQYPWRYEFFT